MSSRHEDDANIISKLRKRIEKQISNLQDESEKKKMEVRLSLQHLPAPPKSIPHSQSLTSTQKNWRKATQKHKATNTPLPLLGHPTTNPPPIATSIIVASPSSRAIISVLLQRPGHGTNQSSAKQEKERYYTQPSAPTPFT